jgi:transposase InsO family protein
MGVLLPSHHARQHTKFPTVPRRGPRSYDGTIIPEAVDTMWGTDLTTTITGDGQAAVFIALDHFTAKCVGIDADRRATRLQALEPIRQGVRQRFGGFAQHTARGLSVRHDHGSRDMSDALQAELHFLGIDSSAAFVCAPEGNGCTERFIRRLKENRLRVRIFQTVKELRLASIAFQETDSAAWLIERHGCLSPEAFRQSQVQPTALAAEASTRCLTDRGRDTQPPPAVRRRPGAPAPSCSASGCSRCLFVERFSSIVNCSLIERMCVGTRLLDHSQPPGRMNTQNTGSSIDPRP